MLAFRGVRNDLKEYKKKNGRIKRSVVILILFFIVFSTYADAIQFELETITAMVDAAGPQEMKEKFAPFALKVELLGYFLYLPYPFFFYGKEIFAALRKHDRVIDEYESVDFKTIN